MGHTSTHWATHPGLSTPHRIWRRIIVASHRIIQPLRQSLIVDSTTTLEPCLQLESLL